MKLKIKLTLTEDLLGTKAANPDLYTTYLADQAAEDQAAEEIANAKARYALATTEAERRELAGTSVFHAINGVPGIYDYQIKGFFKDACHSLRVADGMRSADLKAYKTKIDGLVFAGPRFIFLNLPVGRKLDVCERPIRVDGPQGPRVGLCRSESAPAGTTLDVDVTVLAETMLPLVKEWLDYGALRGLGQWRNSGKGRFTWEEVA